MAKIHASFRLEEETLAYIRELARETKVSQAFIVGMAVHRLVGELQSSAISKDEALLGALKRARDGRAR